ncbi:hypothetical protein [Winogradskyella immobilis]|uniref:DinB-like domain-containing protein n=1 Tax=Winogradskyella immobilis TaxID=2816852 RepID=A0ABS8EMT5_9FLAO|nr:hypothetical protein [Winogradskyella immobilis]MCC1484539.1 hypothetical protein [Winogradskyella immobilis]MCG0016631.1 hypothetical protein [Winogradskyella immobilis]
MKKILIIVITLVMCSSYSQDKVQDEIPYYEVPDYSETYTAGTMAARMVDALGFRYYWASYGLTETDLKYKANDIGRNTGETIKHIYDLSKIILNSTLKKPNGNDQNEDLSFEAMRKQTLVNLKTAAEILRETDDMSQFKIIFGEQEIPFWNNINGPISDSIWHCGQIAIYRRSTNNPINPKVDHFSGKVRN